MEASKKTLVIHAYPGYSTHARNHYSSPLNINYVSLYWITYWCFAKCICSYQLNSWKWYRNISLNVTVIQSDHHSSNLRRNHISNKHSLFSEATTVKKLAHSSYFIEMVLKITTVFPADSVWNLGSSPVCTGTIWNRDCTGHQRYKHKAIAW